MQAGEQQAGSQVFPLREIGIKSMILAGLASTLVVVAGVLTGGSTEVVAPLALLPLVFPFYRLCEWTVEQHGVWTAFFLLFMTLQVGHFGEHLAQMFQIHVLGQTPAMAHGIVGKLDIEWVHFTWNSLVFGAAAILLFHFRSNPWLWVTALVAAWHLGEHVAIMSVFLDTRAAGDPGLLAMGGSIAGGLGIGRPDLHFLYNVVETVPLVIAYVYEVRGSGRGRLTARPAT